MYVYYPVKLCTVLFERPLMPSILEVASTRKLRKTKPREHNDQHMRSTQAVKAVPQSRGGAMRAPPREWGTGSQASLSEESSATPHDLTVILD